MKLKKGDTVKVITGKDAGTESKIAKVFPTRNKIIVEGVATAKRSQRATGQTMQGGIIDKDMPIDVSNVILSGLQLNSAGCENAATGKKCRNKRH